MKFVHLAASLLLLNTGFLFAQPGYNGPAPSASPSIEPKPYSVVFQEELDVDNFNRIQSSEETQYFNELTSCLLSDQPKEAEEDLRLSEKTTMLERKMLLSLDEQTIADPEAEEEGMERLAKAINTQQLGQIALLSDQLSTVMTEYQHQEEENDYLHTYLLEVVTENLEPIHWLVQVELGQIR